MNALNTIFIGRFIIWFAICCCWTNREIRKGCRRAKASEEAEKPHRINMVFDVQRVQKNNGKTIKSESRTRGEEQMKSLPHIYLRTIAKRICSVSSSDSSIRARVSQTDGQTGRQSIGEKEINEHHQYQQQWQRRREKTKNWHHAVGDNAPRDIVVSCEHLSGGSMLMLMLHHLVQSISFECTISSLPFVPFRLPLSSPGSLFGQTKTFSQ